MLKLRNIVLVVLLYSFFYSSANAYDLRVLASYTASAQARYPGTAINTRINFLFSEANITLANSGINLRLIPVGFVQINDQPRANPTIQKLNPWILGQMSRNDKYLTYRNTTQADMITLFSRSSSAACGYGVQPGTFITDNSGEFIYNKKWARYALSAVGITCSNNALVHEIGHNFGMGHSPRNSFNNGTIVKYGTGHGVDSLFTTIMAFSRDYGGAQELNRFSNPKAICLGGVPCGVAGVSNAVLAINQVALMGATLAENCRYAWPDSGFSIWCKERMPTPSNVDWLRPYTIRPR